MNNFKKILLTIITCCFCIMPFITHASAPIYLNGDSNFVRIDSHYNSAYYLDRSSIYVQEYNPPEYIIVANICTVNNAVQGNTAISGVTTRQFRYDISNKSHWKMYYSSHDMSEWKYIAPKYTYASNGIVLPAGEMVFYAEYGIPFYGKQHSGLFPQSFYDRI